MVYYQVLYGQYESYYIVHRVYPQNVLYYSLYNMGLIISDMGGVFGFFLGVTILNLLRQTWIYIATFS